jgi:hypothetical protein
MSLAVLDGLTEPGDIAVEVIPEWLCGEVAEVLDPGACGAVPARDASRRLWRFCKAGS